MEKITALAKRRGFIFPGSEIYGGLAGTWDYGPLGSEIRNNLLHLWWRRFVGSREDVYGVKTSILMHARVWDASGHRREFADPLIDCRACKARFRADTIDAALPCPQCGARDFTEARPFNMMFKTFAGPVEDRASEVYLRPETAQGMFVNFKNVLDTMHPTLPFGIAQVGKAFRNEITPGNFIFRSREFEQMEIEYFVRPEEWEKWFDHWSGGMRSFAESVGLKIYEREVPEADRAHYSRRTIDFDFDFPFGREELWGLAYRTDFDLRQHASFSGQELSYFDEAAGKITPHVIEPTFGVERTILALLASAYHEEGDRVLLRLPPTIAPVKVAVFPLVANKPALVEKAREIYRSLQAPSSKLQALIMWDDRGNIGKRYYSQDEIGTPFCVTIDYQTLEDDTVTVRDRDTMKQERVAVGELAKFFEDKLS